MTDEERFKALLGQTASNVNRQAIDLERRVFMSLETKHRRVRRVRWAAGIAWVVLAILFVTAAITEAMWGRNLVTSTLIVTIPYMLLIALFLTVSWYVRNVSLRFDSIQQALAVIQSQLGK